MASLPVNFDPYNPIPNNPFYSPATTYLQGPFGPIVVGSGLSVSPLGVISATGGGGGGGTVTSVTAGLGLLGGVITTSGTISLAPSGVVAGTYNFPTIAVDATGRITSISSGNPVTSISANSPLSVTGSVTSPTISIQQASTTQVGVTQLNNSTSSTLTNQALTAAAGKSLQDQINALSQNANGLILAGTLDASTGNVVSATTAGNLAGFTAGNPVPSASPAINNYYVIVTTGAASYTPTGGTAITNVIRGDYILVSSGLWTILRVGPPQGAYATTTTAGLVELATANEVIVGTDPNLAITPLTGACAYVARKCFTAAGQVLVGTGSNTYCALGIGVDGQVLTFDSSCSAGVKWAPAGGGGGGSINLTFQAPLSATTNPFTGGVAAVSIAGASTAAAGAVQLATPAQTQSGASSALAVTPAGAAATYICYSNFTTSGQIPVASGAGTYALLSPGADNLALIACAACACGLTWGSPTATVAAATPSVIGGFKGFGAGTANNLSVGASSLAALTTGQGNVALGGSAAGQITTGCFNVAIGAGALPTETTGSQNIAIGTGALATSNGGAGNIAIGQTALCAVTTGNRNVAIGILTGDALTTGLCNTFVGQNAASVATTASNNVILGSNAGFGLTTGNCNVFVGDFAGANVTTQSFQYVIGGSGSCSTGVANGGITFQFGGGCALYALANGTNTWVAVSDERLKENVADLALGLDFVNQLQPRSFNWKNDGAAAAGFIAQEVAEVVDEHDADYLHLVDRSNEYMGLSATTLIPVLVNAIKELKAEVEDLKKKLG